MPYIPKDDRRANNPLVVSIDWPDIPTTSMRRNRLVLPIALNGPGELNFAMTTLASEYVRRRAINYSVLNEVMGVFSSAQAEFYRRVVVPYEDVKLSQNGDVYDCLLDLMSPYLQREIDT